MKQLIPYLNFNGNCREAMTFYQACLGGELDLQTIAGSPIAPQCPQEIQDHIMHSTLIVGNIFLLASDMPFPKGYQHGNNFSIYVEGNSAEEVHELFNKFSAGGTEIMPVREEFWGAIFGVLVDKFDIRWQFHFDKNLK